MALTMLKIISFRNLNSAIDPKTHKDSTATTRYPRPNSWFWSSSPMKGLVLGEGTCTRSH